MVWIFFGMYRGVDLSCIYRVFSTLEGRQLVAVRRKLQNDLKVERVMSLPDHNVSPCHLLILYAKLTAHHPCLGTPL